MAETMLERIGALEQTAHGCLTQAAVFRQYLSDGPDTALVQEEYTGLCQMLTTVFQELFALARTLEEGASVNDEEARLVLTGKPPTVIDQVLTAIATDEDDRGRQSARLICSNSNFGLVVDSRLRMEVDCA